MSLELFSILVLLAIFAVGTVKPINLGIMSFVAAFLIGQIGGGLTVDQIFAVYPGDLFILLVGVAGSVTLIDGRGARFTPWSTDPAELANYTLHEHPRSTYDFGAGLLVALREYAPDVLLLPGPGATLGAACAQLIVCEGYAGLRSRAEFEQAQSGPTPILLSVRR